MKNEREKEQKRIPHKILLALDSKHGTYNNTVENQRKVNDLTLPVGATLEFIS
jgi:hypothetical protein